MKLIRVGPVGQETPGLLLDDGTRLDVSDIVADYVPEALTEDVYTRLAQRASQATGPQLDASARLGAPLKRPGKLICIGLNYSDHAKESGMAEPEEPVVFFKATSAICGPNDDLIIPKDSQKTDWEVELAVVIGKRASYVDVDQALDHVLGYCLHNDYSERAYQLEGTGQWVKGKSCDTFAPLGPYIASRDEITDASKLGLWLEVNGERLQDGNTSNLIFDVPFLVSYLSRYMTLEPGDIISTGTPAGVGLGFEPPRYLKAGDVVELGIDGLGTSKQTSVAWTQ